MDEGAQEVRLMDSLDEPGEALYNTRALQSIVCMTQPGIYLLYDSAINYQRPVAKQDSLGHVETDRQTA